RPRLEFLDALFHLVVPGNIGDEVPYVGKRLHWLDRYRPLERNRIQTRHAHQLGRAVDFRGAGPALARLAIPAHGEIERLRRLNLVNRVEHYHSFRDFDGVIAVLPGPLLPAPNSERC